MNLNSQIDWNDTDRIVSNDTRYVSLNGDWWRESSSWQTRQNGTPDLTLMGRTRARLTGLGRARTPSAPQGLLVAESHSYDALDNATLVCTYLDRAPHTTTQTTTTPASSLAAETVARCGLTVSSRSATGVTTTYAYDALGRQISQTDGRGNTSHLVYDAQGRVAKTIDALGHETTYAYDALGRQTSVTDPLGHVITTTYDAEGRVLAQRGATYPVDYAYDAYGNKVAMTTYRNEELVDGDTTRWLYDEPSGCMTNKVYADGKGPTYSYTPDGKLARRTWARGIATDYTYDNAGHLTRTEYDDNGVTPTITMSYDRVGNLTAATTAGVVTNLYAYDLHGLCTNEWQNGFEIARFHDALGRPAGYAADGERRTTLAYDAFGRLATMEIGSHGQFAWAYHAGASLKAALAYPNGLVASWAYDAENRLAQVRNATPSAVISRFDYAYDAAGRRIAVARSGTAFGDLSGATDRYAYNARGEVTGARRTKGGQPVQGFSEDFAYDPIGNRTSSATYDEAGEAQVSTYVANALNQYVSRTTPGFAAVRGEADPDAAVTVNERPAYRLGAYFFGGDVFDNSASGGFARLETYAALAQEDADGNDADDLVSSVTGQVYVAQSPEAFAYDADGNQTLVTTRTGRWRVEYNGENRPVRWTREGDGKTVAMTYDHMGRRRTKGGQRFFYDGYLQVANERTVSNAVVRQSFVWDPTEPVATRPLAWFGSNAPPRLYTHDGNKNVSEVVAAASGTNATVEVIAHYDYAAFGAVIAQKGDCAEANPWRFSSEYEDTELGLDYYNYRHYEPVAGRWMSRDPLGGNRGIGLYCFVINKGDGSDILGLWPVFDSKYWTKKSDEEFESRHGSYSAVTVYSFVLGDRLDRGGSKKPWNSDEYAFFTVERLSGEQCKLAKKVNRRLEYYVDSKCPCKVCYRATANFPNVEVNVKFNREESWIKESMFKEENAEALRILMGHESTHWVIACTFASRASEAMRKMFKKGDVFCNEGWAKRNAKDLLVTDIVAAFRKLESDDAEEQSKFDNETSHGTSLEKEQEWERRYEVK